MKRGPTAALEAAPLAFFGDVHGNAEALDALLKELDRAGVTRLFVAGDLVFGGADPLGVWRTLEARKAVMVRGASDTALVSLTPEALAAHADADQDRLHAFLETRTKLGDLVLERIRRLPERFRLPLTDGREVVMVHGSPADPLTELSHELDDAEMLALLADDPADIVVCAGTHVPFARQVAETLVLNVGSVGASPEGRVAHYLLLSPAIDGPVVEQRWVEY